MSVKTGKQATKLLRRLKEYVGDITNLTTTAKTTAVAAINEVDSHTDDITTKVFDMCLSAAGLAIGTTSKAKVKIVNTVTYLIDGVFYSKSAAEIAFTPTTHDIPADADSVQEAVYTVSLQADGTATLTMGTIASGSGNASVPDGPDDECVIGHVRIAVDAGATDFDASSDDLDAAHLTVTYTDVAMLP